VRYKGAILFIILAVGLFFVFLSQREKVDQPKRAIEGLEVPEFSLVGADGKTYNIGDLKGKTVFIHFWAAWCKECKKELPSIYALYKRKKDDPGFVFISVAWREDPVKTKKYLKEQNMDIPVYIDPDQRAARIFGVTGVPETYIINPEGVLQKRVIGPGKWETFQVLSDQ